MKISVTQEKINSIGGLHLIRRLLSTVSFPSCNYFVNKNKQIDHQSILLSYIFLLSLGKSSFESIEEYHDDESFHVLTGLGRLPSGPLLRQRLDLLGNSRRLSSELTKLNQSLLSLRAFGEDSLRDRKVTPCDIDVSVLDNSDSRKEGVSFTYKKVFGYSPIFAHLGTEGFLLDCELREGSAHSQKGTPAFLKRCIRQIRNLKVNTPVIRLDSGFDAAENLEVMAGAQIDFIVKRNPRSEDPDLWLLQAKQTARPQRTSWGQRYTGIFYRQNILFDIRVIRKDRDGNPLLFPYTQADTYHISEGMKAVDPFVLLNFYRRRGTSEQFHSELKHDMGVERLPSGKFATNALVLQLAMIAYNLLRSIGQIILSSRVKTPLRKSADRRRLKTIICNLVTAPCKLVSHAGRKCIKFYYKWKWLEAYSFVAA